MPALTCLLVLSPCLAGWAPVFQGENPPQDQVAGQVPVPAGVDGSSDVQAAGKTKEDDLDEEDETGYEGFRFRSPDGQFSLRFFGVLDNDWAFFSADRDVRSAGRAFNNGAELRRARFGLKGRLYDWIGFKLSFDFGSVGGGIKDAYFQGSGFPGVDHIRIGHFKEPFGLEQRTGSGSLTFMERSLTGALAPGRNIGIMAFDSFHKKRATWAAGIFRETNSSAFAEDLSGGQEFAFTSRVTWLPWYEKKGRRFLHLGAAVSFRNADDGFERFRVRPESHLAPRIVDTGKFPAGSIQLGGLEAALVYGPASLQAEYNAARVGEPKRASPVFTGYYVQASWLLTGENRRYKNSIGSFSEVLPEQPFQPKGGGGGAWELATRFSSIDLQDAGIPGGEAQDLTFGINWYLNPQLRFQANYVISNLDTFGNARIFEFRFRLDF